MNDAGLALVGHTTFSGVQRKVALDLDAGDKELLLAPERSRFILKPQSTVFDAVPENEFTTLCLAALSGIETAHCALLPLQDGRPALVSRRFDRTSDHRKLRAEEFCQLARKPPAEKYSGSGELCAKIVRRYASEPGIEAAKLFRLMLFSWWVGNEDLHLKNLVLLAGQDGLHRLSPAYDLVSSRLYVKERDLAMPIGGKDRKLRRKDWLAYAAVCGLPVRAAEKVLVRQMVVLDAAVSMIERSPLPALRRLELADLVRARTATIHAAED